MLPLDADGDGEVDLDDDGLPEQCVLPEDCADTHAPMDVNEDNRPDLCTIAPPEEGEEGEPDETALEEPTSEATPPQGTEVPQGQPQALDPEQSSEQSA